MELSHLADRINKEQDANAAFKEVGVEDKYVNIMSVVSCQYVRARCLNSDQCSAYAVCYNYQD